MRRGGNGFSFAGRSYRGIVNNFNRVDNQGVAVLGFFDCVDGQANFFGERVNVADNFAEFVPRLVNGLHTGIGKLRADAHRLDGFICLFLHVENQIFNFVGRQSGLFGKLANFFRNDRKTAPVFARV